MATVTVRKLDPQTWEPQFGSGQSNFISDLEAATQIIATRLKLFQTEWWLDVSDGLPMFQSIEGASGSPLNVVLITNIIAARIRTTQYVTDVTFIAAELVNRRYSFSCDVSTQFGSLNVTNMNATAGLPAPIDYNRLLTGAVIV